jgi:hypothetical protein
MFHVLQFHQKWSHAKKTLQKQSQLHDGTPVLCGLVQKVYDALSCVAWAVDIQGFSAKVGTEYLATYMNDD